MPASPRAGDLISKVARVLGEDLGDDVSDWYRERFGEEPDYSKLLDTLAKSPAERSALLTVHRGPSLSVPDSPQSPMEALTKCTAVRLFVERAATVQPGFALTDENAAAVTQITRSLNGIPLAIELAAARTNVLSAEQIADRLDDSFRLLTRGRRTDIPRHQTLRATVEWSYRLSPAVHTGLRRGELLGLRWENADLDRGQISIQRTLQYIPRRGYSVTEPKSAKGRRTIALGPAAVEVLRARAGSQAKARRSAGPAWEDQGWVFTRPDGRPLDPDVVFHTFHDLVGRFELPLVRFHDLRHTHATLLLSQGIHPKIVQERLGHTRSP